MHWALGWGWESRFTVQAALHWLSWALLLTSKEL